MRDLDMLTTDIRSSYAVKKWFVVLLKFLVQRVFVLVVSLENNIKIPFLKGQLLVQLHLLSLYILS